MRSSGPPGMPSAGGLCAWGIERPPRRPRIRRGVEPARGVQAAVVPPVHPGAGGQLDLGDGVPRLGPISSALYKLLIDSASALDHAVNYARSVW